MLADSTIRISALPVLAGTLCILAIAYRYYSAFIAAKVLSLDDTRVTPSHKMADGHNYVPTNRWVLFGHHFAAITGAGPLLGPVLAAQFGFAPGLLWILAGVTLGGAVHDFVTLACSTRRRGKSLAEMARQEIGTLSGVIVTITILLVVVIAIAAMANAVINALIEQRGPNPVNPKEIVVLAHASSWGAFTLACSVVIALAMGLWMHKVRKGAKRGIPEATAFGVVTLLACVYLGALIPGSWLEPYFALTKHKAAYSMATYGFIASVLPVWMMLCPRDYLSSFLKLGTIGAIVIGIMIMNPTLRMPAVSEYLHTGTPVVMGSAFPFVFITIACGAISGFHALIASGTTPKMIDRERDCRAIGYGAMLCEGLVGVTALVAASSLVPDHYFAINIPAGKYLAWASAHGMNVKEIYEELGRVGANVGESVIGRQGGSVTLAIGITQIFHSIPGYATMARFIYHFVIMFEALFILTTVDTGTRVARFLVQEAAGRVWKPAGRTDWLPGTVVATGVVVAGWTYLVLDNNMAQLWPMLGVANQLLATTALAIATIILINEGKRRYVWVTGIPMAFVATTTIWAGILSAKMNFAAAGQAKKAVDAFGGNLRGSLLSMLVGFVAVVLIDVGIKAFRRGVRGDAPPATDWALPDQAPDSEAA